MVREFEIGCSATLNRVSTGKVEVPLLDAWDERFDEYERPSVANFAVIAWVKRGWGKEPV